MEEYEAIAEYEGYSIEEAKLTYAARKDLPSSAFCGPDRTFPAQDAAHVRNAFARLAQSKLPPSVKAKINACLVRRAKRFGVEHKVEESEAIATNDYSDAVIKWYLEELGISQ